MMLAAVAVARGDAAPPPPTLQPGQPYPTNPEPGDTQVVINATDPTITDIGTAADPDMTEFWFTVGDTYNPVTENGPYTPAGLKIPQGWQAGVGGPPGEYTVTLRKVYDNGPDQYETLTWVRD